MSGEAFSGFAAARSDWGLFIAVYSAVTEEISALPACFVRAVADCCGRHSVSGGNIG